MKMKSVIVVACIGMLWGCCWGVEISDLSKYEDVTRQKEVSTAKRVGLEGEVSLAKGQKADEWGQKKRLPSDMFGTGSGQVAPKSQQKATNVVSSQLSVPSLPRATSVVKKEDQGKIALKKAEEAKKIEDDKKIEAQLMSRIQGVEGGSIEKDPDFKKLLDKIADPTLKEKIIALVKQKIGEKVDESLKASTDKKGTSKTHGKTMLAVGGTLIGLGGLVDDFIDKGGKDEDVNVTVNVGPSGSTPSTGSGATTPSGSGSTSSSSQGTTTPKSGPGKQEDDGGASVTVPDEGESDGTSDDTKAYELDLNEIEHALE